MYVCICRAVTDKEIRAAIAEGARTMRDLRRKLGVCTECGKCGACARGILEDQQSAKTAQAALGCAATQLA